jgi:endoglucanase
MATGALGYLRELTALSGPSGAEEDVIRRIVGLVRPLVDRVEVDLFGNVIAVRESGDGAPRLAVAAHMDEVGFRIRRIEPDGYLRFEKVGGTDNRVLLGQRVRVRGENQWLIGIIGTKSAHLLSDTDRTSVPQHAEAYIDIGARSAEDVARMGVHLGAPAGFVGELTELGSNTGRFTAHALDDRVGCAVVLATLEALRGATIGTSITALFTVQEEVGLRGAQAAARHATYDVGLAIDTTAVDDTPDTGPGHLLLGAGAAVKIMDFSLLAHPAVQRGLREAAARAGVPVQDEILMRIGTDAGALQHAEAGIPAGTLSIGTRYTHSPVEALDEVDLDGAVAILTEFVRGVRNLDLRFTAVE